MRKPSVTLNNSSLVMSASFKKGLYSDERKSVVNGFLRLNSDGIPIPRDIYGLCHTFYNEFCFWRLRGSALSNFKSMEFRKKVSGPTFYVKGIKFQLEAYPNGELDGEEGYVQLYLKVVHHPPEMKTLQLYLVMFCEQNHYYFRRAKVFNLLAEDKDHSHAWAPHHMKLKECQSLQEIIFGANVYVDHIEMKKDHPHYITFISMHRTMQYKWSMDESQIAELRTLDFNQNVGSPLFDGGNWGLTCAPHGDRRETKGNVALGLCLYHMPFGIKAMHVSLTLECIETGAKMGTTRLYQLNHKWQPWPTDLMKTDSLQKLTHLTFTVSLRILHLLSEIESEVIIQIPQEEWSKYGIIE